MTIQPVLLALALAALPLAGCSHDQPATHGHHASASGGEHHGDAHPTRGPHAEHHADAAHADAPTHAHAADHAADHAQAPAAPTASDQSEAVDDLEITRQIRVALIGDSSLSFGARFCTIITRDAVVTLRGDVSSNVERDLIARHARAVTGVARVDNLLAVSE